MYVTRPRSVYHHFPGALSLQPQADVAYSGHLVVTDEESEAMDSFCCGIWRNHKINRLPFPSDRVLQVVHSSLQEEVGVIKAWFVPVLDQPLSSNRYYVIKAKGRRKGQAYTCSREGDVGMCCCRRPRVESKTRPFDHRDRYQQLEIRPFHGGGFCARSVEWDGHPPNFLSKGGWEVYKAPSCRLHLHEGAGLLPTPPLGFPDRDLPLSARRSTPVVVGRWYCPCVMVKDEEMRAAEQMKKCMVYEVSLKQWWEQIHSVENEGGGKEAVVVDARVRRLVCRAIGMEAEKEDGGGADGFVWFRGKGECRRRVGVGLSLSLYEKMRWVQETRGWFDGEREVRVKGNKEVGSESSWTRFGCYVLVESFVFRRMDGSLLINFNFRNTDKIVCKWE
ncbi:uncharacterized protein LOC125208001 [Salvia hispanica]|uniref:uncharacterized protein LOC125208001 n=1 Tax=Salvia hispanica TaxID=49212 RepID=UPI0020095FA2|nr:uncharacterized protein LOC125208001 [Salvia hispanica]